MIGMHGNHCPGMKWLRRSAHRRRRRGMSLVEVAISTLLVAAVLIGALQCLGSSLRSRAYISNTLRGKELAQHLMTEVLNCHYVEPGLLPVFGPELGETLLGRLNFDDVDDYHSWSESPPREKSNAVLPDLAGWQRSVSVDYVQPSDPATTSATDQGVKRVIVTVRYNGTTVATQVGLRSDCHYLP